VWRGRVPPVVQPQPGEFLEERLHRDPGLQAGQVGAEAEVRAVGEGQVTGGVRPPDLEGVRIAEDPGIPVRAGQGHRDLVTGAYPGAAELSVAGRVAVDHGRGRFQPQGFLDRRRDQRGVGPYEFEFGGGGEQVQHRVRDHALGGLDPAEQQDAGVGDGLVRGERSGRVGQQRRFGRRDDLAEAGGELAERGRARGGYPGTCRLGLDRGHDPVVPAEDLPGVGLPEAERLGHDRDGQRAGHRAAELGLAVWLDSADQAFGLGAAERVEPGVDLLRPEGAGKRGPVAGVPRAVQREHARPDDLGRGEPGIIDGERPRVPQHLDGHVIPGDQPGPEDRHPANRGGGPQPGQHRMRVRLQVGQRDPCGRVHVPGVLSGELSGELSGVRSPGAIRRRASTAIKIHPPMRISQKLTRR